jgi:signal transduction histidine kinase
LLPIAIRRSAASKVVDALILGVALVLIWYSWKWLGQINALQPILVLIPSPLFAWIAARHHLSGVCAVTFAVGTMAMYISASNEGPFVTGSLLATTMIVQIWTIIVGCLGLMYAKAMQQIWFIRGALADTHQEIHDLVGKIVATQEEERARIARDLHDDVNQRLASASIQLSMLKRKAAEQDKGGITQVQQQLYELSDAIRQLSHDLHPSMLKQTGLADALRRLCATQTHHNGPEIEVRVHCNVDAIPEIVALGLYRIAQEGLSNAVRHAFATRIIIALDMVNTAIQLTIEDNGRGFDADFDRLGKPHGLGLVSIDDRVKLMEGFFRIESGVGKGAKLCVQIPLHRRNLKSLHA